MKRILRVCLTCLLLAALAVLVLDAVVPLFRSQPANTESAAKWGAPYQLREYFFLHGVAESGALNLVAAIYLGYRAFDTLGETIVLVISVAGVLLFTGAR